MGIASKAAGPVVRGVSMSDKTDSPVIIDFAEARQKRIHDINDARLEAMRGAFAKALPLAGPQPPSKSKKKRKKKPR